MIDMQTDFDAARTAMIDSQLRPSDVTDPDIVAAFARVAREDFVPERFIDIAYMDRPIPLNADRALNPPLVTGRMLIAAGKMAGTNILLIGSASGYTAALLAELGANVTAVESDASLQSMAPAMDNVEPITAPLAEGYAANAPYDIILLDGAIEVLPQALIDQVRDGGMVIAGVQRSALTHLARGVKAAGTVVLRPFADMDVAALPGFAAPRNFTF
jgi:protein-L-isoaspartate(D-aspartate) O-methyltransferase